MTKVETSYVVDIIGQRQRGRFERDGTVNGGSCLADIAGEIGVSELTVRKHIDEARRRGWKILERKRPAPRHPVTGKGMGGRLVNEYYLVDGHRWAGPGKPLATMVPVGAATTQAAGRYDGMSHAQVKQALAVDRDSYAMTDGTRSVACSAAGVARWGS